MDVQARVAGAASKTVVEKPTVKALVPQPSGASVSVQGLVDGDAHAGAWRLETDGGVQTLTKWLAGVSIRHVKVSAGDVAAVFGGRGAEHVDSGDACCSRDGL